MSSKRIRTSKEEGMVGDEQEVFTVHEGLIRASSPFFNNAMAHDWKESQQRTIHLPDDEPEIFAVYMHWLYRRTLPVFCNEPGLPGTSEYLDLVKAYVLGFKILDLRFRDSTIDAIVEKSESEARDGRCPCPSGEVVKYALDNTNESAPIRELLLDMCANWGRRTWLRLWADCLPQSFLFELASTLLDLRADSDWYPEAYEYHYRRSDEGNSPR
ncbi:hypothetical protein Asppvi_001828 [Aspergillus pseudoviridinutans]|uniref:BTB domain-containing protein n=1 Tax=Aspergillus pseudoviridinutans TaxID=1517512 RepID=A0A9P3BNH0_9EURO|nr:uncharacterized protein Asppvi_001828 [Aspergillus pseudoviridinutans]GIJ92550.1 hypothetical protein Asppvi_001828 [Aspergillus pseudoviridinutans]